MGRLSNWFYSFLEHWGSKIHVYAWNKKYSKRDYVLLKGNKTGRFYTIKKNDR